MSLPPLTSIETSHLLLRRWRRHCCLGDASRGRWRCQSCGAAEHTNKDAGVRLHATNHGSACGWRLGESHGESTLRPNHSSQLLSICCPVLDELGRIKRKEAASPFIRILSTHPIPGPSQDSKPFQKTRNESSKKEVFHRSLSQDHHKTTHKINASTHQGDET